ncbi:ATP-binding protein [Acetivibrio mesophilus]|uniref:DNA replication protein DnaC n=1 Tax=Acetivibrio mesophilus TaxID=2487273 RepID=A0A4Q0I3J4_9FIRM|nr:ATP-binding protein [Acetivibrio mesophilus]ODM27204.1 DNA replication protein DnaC [Clostridium sp. Bc-iso-3]RXE58761.1 DNA replication protein DnaC [Acetivibrio mesophilus]
MNRDIHRIIINEYESRQQAASHRQLLKKEEVYKKIPRIEEIDNQIHLTGIKYNKAILLGIQPSDRAISELLDKIDCLKREKRQLLLDFSYPENYLELEFQCKQCKDTGFVETSTGTEKCSCYRQQYINHLFKQSNIKVLDAENFSTFNEGYYPDEVNEKKFGIRISPRQNIIKIRERSQAFIENIDNPQDKNLFFSGPTGVGKTFMVNCIASELLKKGRTVLYQTAQSLFKVINDYRLSALKDNEFEDTVYSDIFNVELLIIDDLGTESPTATRYAELLNILNTRQENNLSVPCKTIIASNLGINLLNEYYDERIVSRIIGGFDLFRFAGNDIRMLKKTIQA